MRNSTLAHQLAILQHEGKISIVSLPWRLDVLTRHALAVFTSPGDRGAQVRLRKALGTFDAEELAELQLGRLLSVRLLLLPKSTASRIFQAASKMRAHGAMHPRVRRGISKISTFH